MYKLKPLSREGVPAALKKAERYRLLNEPWDAESICRDVLEIDAANQEAIVTLVLALTDQFGAAPGTGLDEARALTRRLESEYRRAYFLGIISERHARALLASGAAGANPNIYDALRRAMASYEEAERIRPQGEDDPILRWNTCARILTKYKQLAPAPVEGRMEGALE